MHYANQVASKFNRIRKKNWSAPTIMAAFIIVCMIIVYSFESLGLAKREKNLDYRSTAPERIASRGLACAGKTGKESAPRSRTHNRKFVSPGNGGPRNRQPDLSL